MVTGMNTLDKAGEAARLLVLCRQAAAEDYARYKSSQAEKERVAKERDRLVRAALADGHTLSQVASVTGLSRQRIEQVKNGNRN